MNRDDFIEKLMIDTGIKTKTTVEKVFDSLLDTIIGGLKTDGEVTIPPFGKFKAVLRPARMGRNPQTGEEIEIPERTAIKFLASKGLKNDVQDPDPEDE